MLIMNISKNPVYSNHISGSFYHSAPKQYECKFKFSCDHITYYQELDRLLSIRRDSSSFHGVREGIPNFIEGCLVLGEFLHVLRGCYIDLDTWSCKTDITLAYREQDVFGHPVDIRGLLITFSVSKSDEVTLNVMASDRGRSSGTSTDITFSSQVLPPQIRGMDYKRCMDYNSLRNVKSFKLLSNGFHKPTYKRLPLYINTPFIQEYARSQMLNPTDYRNYIEYGYILKKPKLFFSDI